MKPPPDKLDADQSEVPLVGGVEAELLPPATARTKRLGGLLVRKEGWTLSRTGKVLVFLFVLGVGLILGKNLCAFLSVNRPVNSGILVVEGWIPPSSMAQAAKMIKAGHYQQVITSGTRAGDEWGLSPNDTYAELAAVRLTRFGISSNLVQPISSWAERKDRTYNSALAIKKWFQDRDRKLTSFDVLTLGPHARRSRLLYEKAFGSGVEIGIIATEDPLYDPAHWWRSSEGVREVLSESFAYVYARILFHPSE